MRRLADITGDEAMDVLADIIDPASEIAIDEKFMNLARSGQKIKAVEYVIREHKKSILTIMAILEGEDPASYSPSIVRLPVILLEFLNDPDLQLLFPSQDPVTSSGSAMENTEEVGEVN